jgi:hypothetical protein
VKLDVEDDHPEPVLGIAFSRRDGQQPAPHNPQQHSGKQPQPGLQAGMIEEEAGHEPSLVAGFKHACSTNSCLSRTGS